MDTNATCFYNCACSSLGHICGLDGLGASDDLVGDDREIWPGKYFHSSHLTNPHRDLADYDPYT